MVDLLFLNEDRELVGIVDTATSIQWLERYYEVGTFEVYVAINQSVVDIVNKSYYISRSDSEYVGVIERIEIEDTEDGQFLLITGQMAESLIGRRIVRYLTYYTNTLFNDIKKLLDDNLLNPVLQQGETVSPRKMFCFDTTIENKLLNNTSVEIQASFENNLLEYIQETLKPYGASIKCTLGEDKKFHITIFNAEDRSFNQDVNPYITFSKELDNLIRSNYIFDETSEINSLYVGGEGDVEGIDKKIEKYPTVDQISDIYRKESFINASDLKQVWTEEENGISVEKSLTDEEYRKLLRIRGQESVVNPSETFEAQIDISMYVYNTDYYLGDIISIYNDINGMYFNKRLIGMDIVDDENGQTLEPTLE